MAGLLGDEADEAVRLLAALVEAESSNPPGDTTRPTAVAEAFLREAGLAVERIAIDPAKPNLVVKLENGPGPVLGFNAHLDTVPPGDAAAWSVPPLELTMRDGRLLGLGTGNMKAAAAAMMIAARRLDRSRERWRGTLALTLVSDECVFGPAGAVHLLETRPDLLGDWLICGEGPGGMGLAIAEKGTLWIRLTATGRVGQGMLTRRGGSAPARLAAALCEIDRWNDLRAAPPLAELAHPGNGEGQRVSANVGALSGGSTFSQAVAEAAARIDIRIPPGLKRTDIAGRLDALCADGGLAWEEKKGWDPNWSLPDSRPARAIRAAAEAVRGAPPAFVTRVPASDASRWRARGVPAICFGPQPEHASGPDDYVLKRDFLDCIAIYAEAALHLLAPQTAE